MDGWRNNPVCPQHNLTGNVDCPSKAQQMLDEQMQEEHQTAGTTPWDGKPSNVNPSSRKIKHLSLICFHVWSALSDLQNAICTFLNLRFAIR